MADKFQGYVSGLESPATEWANITPSDVADLSITPRALDCANSGTAVIVSRSGAEVTINLTAGNPYPVRPSRVKAIGTTATGIIGLW